MSVLKSFDHTLCFVNTENKLTREQPRIKLQTNKSLSLILAYFYTILKHAKDTIVVNDKVYDIITKYFPKEIFPIVKESEHRPIDDSESEENDKENKVWRIRQVNATEVEAYYMKGDLFMAIYTSEDNVLIYNIYSEGSDVVDYNTEHILGALKYFNGVFRSNIGGTAKNIYRDPVIQSTKLRYNYDQMFGLWLADKYLQMMADGKYLKSQSELKSEIKEPDEPLSQCMGFFEIIKKASVGLLDKEVVVRKFDSKSMSNVIMMDLILEPLEDNKIDIKNISLPNKEYKSNLFSTLYFLLIEQIGKTDDFTLYVIKFNTYNHLDKILEYFPSAKIIVHDESKTSIVPKGIELVKTLLLPATIRKKKKESVNKIFLVSGLEHNDVLIKALTEGTQDNAALVPYTSASFQPLYTFASLFTPLSAYKGYSVFHDSVKNTMGTQNLVKTKFRARMNLLALNYRDVNKWSYTMEIGGPEMSFDEVYLNLVKADASIDPDAESSSEEEKVEEVEKNQTSSSSSTSLDTESSESSNN